MKTEITVIFKTACGATRAQTWGRSDLRERWIVPLMPTESGFHLEANYDGVPPHLGQKTREFRLWHVDNDVALYREVVSL